MAGVAFVSGVFLSGPRWEHNRNFFLKHDIMMSVFFAAIAMTLGIGLYRKLKDAFASK